MVERKIKSYIGLFLLVLMSIGLTISTLHSHHHLQWGHSTDYADTGQCITSDESICPITGYLLEVDVPPVFEGNTFFGVEEVIVESFYHAFENTTATTRGRSPPAAA